MLKRYLRLKVLINNISQVELQDVTINADAKKQPVETMQGLVGFTPGAKSVTISFKSAVPISGPEFDPISAAVSSEQYTVQVPIGEKTLVTQGEFMNSTLSASTGSSTELSFEFMGTYNEPK